MSTVSLIRCYQIHRLPAVDIGLVIDATVEVIGDAGKHGLFVAKRHVVITVILSAAEYEGAIAGTESPEIPCAIGIAVTAADRRARVMLGPDRASPRRRASQRVNWGSAVMDRPYVSNSMPAASMATPAMRALIEQPSTTSTRPAPEPRPPSHKKFAS